MKGIASRNPHRRKFLRAGIVCILLGISALLWLATGASAQNPPADAPGKCCNTF
jgi:hypothetical protein